ncbi:hypothetical protein RVV18_005399 [Burkholderia ambifaria]|nr:hypothetical protein [Burkholderia ambifaria]
MSSHTSNIVSKSMPRVSLPSGVWRGSVRGAGGRDGPAATIVVRAGQAGVMPSRVKRKRSAMLALIRRKELASAS